MLAETEVGTSTLRDLITGRARWSFPISFFFFFLGFVTSSIHIIKEKDRNRNRTKREIYGCVKKILVCFAPSFHPKQMQERSFREGARDPGASL